VLLSPLCTRRVHKIFASRRKSRQIQQLKSKPSKWKIRILHDLEFKHTSRSQIRFLRLLLYACIAYLLYLIFIRRKQLNRAQKLSSWLNGAGTESAFYWVRGRGFSYLIESKNLVEPSQANQQSSHIFVHSILRNTKSVNWFIGEYVFKYNLI